MSYLEKYELLCLYSSLDIQQTTLEVFKLSEYVKEYTLLRKRFSNSHGQTDAANCIPLLCIHTHTHTYTQGTYMRVYVLSACHVPAQDLHVDSTEIMSCFHDKLLFIIIVSSIIIPLSSFLLPSLPPTTICLQQMVVG